MLPDVHWVGGNPWDGSKANVYGWAAWNGPKATLALRNPAASRQTFTITLREHYPHAKIVYIIGAIRTSKRLLDIQEAHDAAIADAASRGDYEVYRMDFTPDDGSLGSGAVGHPSMRHHALMAEELTAFLRGITGWE